MKVQMKKLSLGTAALLSLLFSSAAFAHAGHDASVSFMSVPFRRQGLGSRPQIPVPRPACP